MSEAEGPAALEWAEKVRRVADEVQHLVEDREIAEKLAEAILVAIGDANS